MREAGRQGGGGNLLLRPASVGAGLGVSQGLEVGGVGRGDESRVGGGT